MTAITEVERRTAIDADRAGLTYVSDEEPGIRRVDPRQGLRLRQRQGRTVRDPRDPAAHQAARDAPGVDRGVDLVRSERAHPGDGAGCARAEAVPLSPGFHEGAGRAQSTSASSISPTRFRLIRRRVAQDMGRRGLPWEKVVATVVHLLEFDADPCRQCGLCAAERQLRADHAPRPPRRGRGRCAPLRVQGQERQDVAVEADGPAGGADRQVVPGHSGPASFPVHR